MAIRDPSYVAAVQSDAAGVWGLIPSGIRRLDRS
jgi:hypothetical protein